GKGRPAAALLARVASSRIARAVLESAPPDSGAFTAAKQSKTAVACVTHFRIWKRTAKVVAARRAPAACREKVTAPMYRPAGGRALAASPPPRVGHSAACDGFRAPERRGRGRPSDR